MSCPCGYADECDGETAVFYPLQDGGMCSVRSCQNKEYSDFVEYQKQNPPTVWGVE